MSIQTLDLLPARIAKFKGEIIKHAIPMEIMAPLGRQVQIPQNSSDTYIVRRILPYGANATNSTTQNTFFQNAPGDRGTAITQAHLTSEGITPLPDSITAVNVTTVIQEYSCLYGFSNKVYDLYEDDIPKEMIRQVGERVTFVSELIIYNALKACTNQYFGGGGTSRATVAGPLTLGLVRKIVKNLQGNHAMMVNEILDASAKYNTSPISRGYFVYVHTDLEPDIRDLENFIPIEKYATGSPLPTEIGATERFRFIGHPDLPSFQDAGAAIGATGLNSTSGVNIDVYPVIVCAKDAWSQLAVRGLTALRPTFLPPGKMDKSDPTGVRGYVGTTWRKAATVENPGWMAVAFVGTKVIN